MQRRRYVSMFTESISFATVSHVELQLSCQNRYCLLSASHCYLYQDGEQNQRSLDRTLYRTIVIT